MTDALLVSNLLLWCVVIVLGVVVLALARQVGVLHERVAPAGALHADHGTEGGRADGARDLPRASTAARSPSAVPTGTAVPRWCCGSRRPARCARRWCRRRSRWRRAERLRLVFASDGDKLEQHQAYVGDLGIAAYPYVVSQALGLAYAVSKLPFAVLIGGDGVLRSKGLVNTREHLESLVESMRSGVAIRCRTTSGSRTRNAMPLSKGQPT